MGFYFFSFFLVVSITLMNLVTAVIVEGAVTQAQQDKHEQHEHLQRDLKSNFPKVIDMFMEINVRKVDCLSLDDLSQVPASLLHDMMAYMEVNSVLELFSLLDKNRTGE